MKLKTFSSYISHKGLLRSPCAKHLSNRMSWKVPSSKLPYNIGGFGGPPLEDFENQECSRSHLRSSCSILYKNTFFKSFRREVIKNDRKKLDMDSADPQNRSEWRGRLRGRLVKKPNPR